MLEMDPARGKVIFINLILFFFFLESVYGEERPPGFCAHSLVTGFADFSLVRTMGAHRARCWIASVVSGSSSPQHLGSEGLCQRRANRR